MKLVLFDLDGTLVDSAPEICDAVNDTLDAMHLPRASLERVESWIGHGTQQLLLQALAFATGRPAAEVARTRLWLLAQPRFARAYERRSGTSSRLYANAHEVLHTLGARGIRRALVTNKEQRFTLPLLRRHGLAPLFDAIVCGDTLATRKPEPAGVHKCLASFGVAARSAAFVGDSAIDVATARNAGVTAWAVAHGYNMGEPIARSNPDRVLGGLGDVLELAR